MKKQSAKRSRASGPLRQKRRRSLINLIGGLLLVAAGALIALLFARNTPWLWDWYEVYQQRLQQLEDYLIDLPQRPEMVKFVIPPIVLLLYALKSVVPFFPISMMCFITGAVLPMTTSFAVNIAGVVLLVSIKYWWGRRLGGGQTQKLLKLHPTVRAFLENESKSKPWLLFMFRLVPVFPVNPVSQTYGAMTFDFIDYTLISLLGFLPRLIAYPYLGGNVFDPLSNSFLVPLIIIFTLSGVSVVGINMAVAKRQKET